MSRPIGIKASFSNNYSAFHSPLQQKQLTYSSSSRSSALPDLRLFASLVRLHGGSQDQSDSGLAKLTVSTDVIVLEKNRYQYLQIGSLKFIKPHLKKIDESCFAHCSFISMTLCIPKTVEVIGGNCFSFAKMETLHFEDGSQLQEIGESAFQNSSITTIIIPVSVKTIGKNCFRACGSLQEIQFQTNSHLEQISESTFDESSLVRIIIPKSVKRLCSYCFHECKSLEEVLFESGSTITTIDSNVFESSSLPQIIIPASVEILGSCSFFSSSLKEIQFEQNSKLQCIEQSAFLSCPIQEIIIPNSVTTLGQACFSYCSSLKKVDFEPGSKLQQISADLLSSCSSLERFMIPKSVQTIDGSAFKDIPPSSLVIEEGSQYFSCENMLILNAAKTELILSLSQTNEIIIPKSIEGFGVGCFSFSKSLKTITFEPDSNLRTIGDKAFSSLPLEVICIPGGVTIIGESSFSYCQSLKEVKFETNSQLQRIEDDAFRDCSFRQIILPKTVYFIAATAFRNVPLELVSIPPDSAAFQTNDSCLTDSTGKHLVRYFGCKSVFTIPSMIEVIGECSFQTELSPEEIQFEPGSNIREFQYSAFSYSSLKRIIIPNSIEEIGSFCFSLCYSLEMVTFEAPAKLKQFEFSLFAYCRLKSISVPCSVEVIGPICFLDSKLEEITFDQPSKLMEIGNEAFSKCSLRTIKIPNSVTTLGASCFASCQALVKVDFESESKLQILGSQCFSDCESLQEITIHIDSKLKRIEEKCFFGTALKIIVLPSTILFIGTEAIPSNCEIKLPVRTSRELSYWVVRHKTDSSIQFDPTESSETRSRSIADWMLPNDLSPLEFVKLVSGRNGIKMSFYKDPQTQEQFIVKEFQFDKQSPESRSMFEREVEALLKLEHPCIINLHGVVLPSAALGPKIVTPYLATGSLAEVLKTNPLPDWWNSTSKAIIIVGIVLAMTLVHEQGFWHRNLIPTNILLDERHFPQICDFGFTRYESGLGMTRTHSQISSLYVPPEMWDESIPYTNKVDVYSFALILYEILVGKAVFAGLERNPLTIGSRVLQGTRGEIPDYVPSNVKDLITKAWSSDPNQRPTFTGVFSFLKEIGYKVLDDVATPTVEAFVHMVEEGCI